MRRRFSDQYGLPSAAYQSLGNRTQCGRMRSLKPIIPSINVGHTKQYKLKVNTLRLFDDMKHHRTWVKNGAQHGA